MHQPTFFHPITLYLTLVVVPWGNNEQGLRGPISPRKLGESGDSISGQEWRAGAGQAAEPKTEERHAADGHGHMEGCRDTSRKRGAFGDVWPWEKGEPRLIEVGELLNRAAQTISPRV